MANPDSKLTAKDFLTAAESRLQNPEKAIDLVHAALDVRLGIEARLNEYLDAYQRAVGSRPKSWKLAQLERKVEAAFRTGGKLVRLEVVDATNDQVVSEHWYTPVTKDLRKMGEKIGNALHYGGVARLSTSGERKRLYRQLLIAAEELRFATTGTLIGPPIHNPMKSVSTFSIAGDQRKSFPPGKRIGTRLTLFTLEVENREAALDAYLEKKGKASEQLA